MYTVAPNNIIFVVKWIHHVFIHISKKIDEIAHTYTHTHKQTHIQLHTTTVHKQNLVQKQLTYLQKQKIQHFTKDITKISG